MLKFKDTDNTELDLIEISSSKKTREVDINTGTPSNTSNNILNTFISLFSDTEGLKSLKSFLITTSLWDLLLLPSDEEFPLIKSKIIQNYFSIPDRISAAFKLETDELFFPKNFQYFTESSLSQVSNLKRFIFALERLEGFALHKLVKIPTFWDSLDFETIFQLSKASKQLFLASLHKNLLSMNFSFEKLFKIIKKISSNLRLEGDDLVQLFFEEFICKGSLDYKELAMLISCYKEDFNLLVNIFTSILGIWSNDSWIFRNSFNTQLHYSSCLIIISSLMTFDHPVSSDLEHLLMNGIQTRLDLSDHQIRLMACCVAEIIINRMHPGSENKLDFSLDPKDEIFSHLKECQKLTESVGTNALNSIGVASDVTSGVASSVTSGVTLNDSHTIDADDADDLKPISSLLIEKEPKNSKTPIPQFLPDCLKVLRSNEEAEVIEKVLHKLEEIFKNSSRLSKQIHAVSGFNTLLTLNDHFEIKNFDHLRQKSMETFLIDQIKFIGPDLMDSLFKSNKLVLGQKMEILSLICSSTQQIFTFKSKLEDSNYLNQFEKTFLASENFKSSKGKNFKIGEFMENLFIPLLTQSVRNFQIFKRSHVMFLDKFLWLQAIILNFSQNYLQFDNLVEKYLDFIHLTLQGSNFITISGVSTNFIEQIPTQKALLIGISVVLNSWPNRFPLLQYYQRLQEIYSFLDNVANGPGFKEDQQLQSLGTSVALALQELMNPQKLIQESAEQLSLDLKTVKISNISPSSTLIEKL